MDENEKIEFGGYTVERDPHDEKGIVFFNTSVVSPVKVPIDTFMALADKMQEEGWLHTKNTVPEQKTA